jgi:Phosphatidylinositol-4-phosphate 5-Kinase
VYYLGIVDFLQDWTRNKRVERTFKIYVGRKDPDGLSVMKPEPYMIRFQNKMEEIFDLEGLPFNRSISGDVQDPSHQPHVAIHRPYAGGSAGTGRAQATVVSVSPAPDMSGKHLTSSQHVNPTIGGFVITDDDDRETETEDTDELIDL